MSSLNKVTLIGNLTRDPEVRSTSSGSEVVTFTVATGEKWKDKTSGEWKEKTEFHRVVCWNDRIGQVAQKYLRKGSKVYVEGSLETRKWTDKSGAEKYSTEVVIQRFRGELVLLDGRKSADGDTPARSPSDDMDSEIPF